MSPLNKRLPREFRNNPGKWLGIIALLVLSISLVAGFLMASSSITRILGTADDDYHIEDGRFTANFKIKDEVIDDVEALGTSVYPNFSYDAPLTIDASDDVMTVRLYENREIVDLPAYFDGHKPETDTEIALDRVFCKNNNLDVGDTVSIDGRTFTISGIMSLSDYQALFEKNTDFVFNAQTFSVAQITPEAFESFKGLSCSYTYSFVLDDRTLTDAQRVDFEEDILEVLEDNNIVLSEFLDRDANNGIGYAKDDLEGDSVMWMTMLYLLIAILAFVFVVLTSSTIDEESAVIGTLLASGYRKREILLHYLALPLFAGLVGAIVGNVLGYTFLIERMSGLYYNSYSLPPYHTYWNWSVFAQSTLLPLALLIAVTLVGLIRKLRCTPLQFLRRETTKRSRKGGSKLPEKLSFSRRFRLRVFGRNISHFATLFLGILFASLLLLFGFCMLPTVDRYASSLAESLVSQHTYTLKAPVELEGTSEQREQYAAALTLADTVDMSEIDEDEIEEKVTNLLENRIEESIETQVENLFNQTALTRVIEQKASNLIDEDRISELAAQGYDVSSLANALGANGGTTAHVASLSAGDIQALLDAKIIQSTWIDMSYYGLPSINLVDLPGSDYLKNIDSSSINWAHLVESGILRSSYVDLTSCGLGVIDLATFDVDSLDVDDLDFDAIDFDAIDSADIGLENIDLGNLSKNEFFSLLRKASKIDEDANVINTIDNGDEAISQAEKFVVSALEYNRGNDAGWESVNVYGIQPNSIYYTDLQLTDDAATVGLGLMMKFDLHIGDTIDLYDRYENKTYTLKIGSVWGSDGTMNVYLPFDTVNELMGNDADYFSGYLSDQDLTFDARYLANDITPDQMDKIGAQMENSMGGMMQLMVGVSIAIYLILMYLLTKTIIERSARAISYMKVFGYTDAEIDRLYLRSITEVVIISLIAALPIIIEALSLLLKVVFMQYNGNFVISLPIERLVMEVALGIVCYAVVAFLHTRRIKRVPLAMALKTQE